MPTDAAGYRRGLACAVAAHVLWGMFPLYWQMLASVPAVELVSHRIVWSFVFAAMLLPVIFRYFGTGGASELSRAIRRPKVWGVYAFAAGMIGINWLAFIWACNHGRVLEASLGYYINPLISILLGVVVLGERLTGRKWSAVALAAVGVSVITVAGGGLPWVSLAMACSFAFYGLAKKKAPLASLSGLTLETFLLSWPALALLALTHTGGDGAFLRSTPLISGLLVLGGLVTLTPLFLFATACRYVPLSTIGVLQYIGPTLQFILGAAVLGESLGRWRLLGFAFVWTGSLIYLSDRRRASDVANAPHRQAAMVPRRLARLRLGMLRPGRRDVAKRPTRVE